MLAILVILHRAFSVTKISTSDLFLKGGEGAENLLSIGGKTDSEGKVTHGCVS